MDNFEVKSGDHVHDLAYGAGVVEQILDEGRFTVRLSSTNRAVTYGSDGVAAMRTMRTLYWAAPRITPPPKGGSATYEIFCDTVRALQDALLNKGL